MSNINYDEIKKIPLGIIYKIEERVDNYLLSLSDNKINLIRGKLNELSRKEKDEINEINKIINKMKKDNNLDFTFIDEEINKNPDFTYNSQDFMK